MNMKGFLLNTLNLFNGKTTMFDKKEAKVISQALVEFIVARTPLEEYIQKRYGTHDERFKQQKREDVKRRVEVAKSIIGDE